jgi:hypothetical protein
MSCHMVIEHSGQQIKLYQRLFKMQKTLGNNELTKPILNYFFFLKKFFQFGQAWGMSGPS